MIDVKEIEKAILDISIKVCRRGEGGAFLLSDELKDYEFMVPQKFDSSTNIFDDPKTIESLALQDGIVWIDTNGNLKGYGIAMTNIKVVLNKGTRHASTLSASKQGNNKIFLISQEDKKIKVFSEGRIIAEIDTKQEGIEKKTGDVVNILQSVGAGTIGMLMLGTASTLIPTLSQYIAIPLIPGLIIFTSIFASAKHFKDTPELKSERIKKIVRFSLGALFILIGLVSMFVNFDYHLELGVGLAIIGLLIAFVRRKK